MKIGLRTPSIKKSIKARTTGRLKRSLKKAANPFYGKKGMGYIKNPKQAIKNKIYHKTTFGVNDIPHYFSKPNATHNIGDNCMNNKKTLSNAWIDFIICLIFGTLGVHKFRDKKTGLGLLYLFTGGLFFFGYLYDCTKYFVVAFLATSQQQKTQSDSSDAELQRFDAQAKKIGLIVIAGFLLFIILIAACSPDTNTADNSNVTIGASSAIETTSTPTTEPPHDHVFIDATCSSPKTCTICNLTEGDTLEHTWVEASCTAPKTCSVCNTTEGETLEHTWKDATCTKLKTCTVCQETTGQLAAHNYSNGKCKVCKEPDPTDPRNITVWIPTNGGKKYHSYSSCSNMKNPKKTTQAKAEKSGYDACSRCN